MVMYCCTVEKENEDMNRKTNWKLPLIIAIGVIAMSTLRIWSAEFTEWGNRFRRAGKYSIFRYQGARKAPSRSCV